MKLIIQVNKVKRSKQKTGFTMVELLFAVANFAFIMMIAISAFIAVMQVYNKASFARQTQQASRVVIDQISRDIQSSNTVWSGTVSPPLCIDHLGLPSCMCLFSADKNLVVYYQGVGDLTAGPAPPEASPSPDNNNKIWRTQFNGDGPELGGSPDTNCENWMDNIWNFGKWRGAGITTTIVTPPNINMDSLLFLPDSSNIGGTRPRYILTIMNLKKGQSSGVANDPFFDDFSINNITSFRN